MLRTDREWLDEYLARLVRQQCKDEMTREMLHRAYDALERSYGLLAQPVPGVWHPEPSNKSP